MRTYFGGILRPVTTLLLNELDAALLWGTIFGVLLAWLAGLYGKLLGLWTSWLDSTWSALLVRGPIFFAGVFLIGVAFNGPIWGPGVFLMTGLAGGDINTGIPDGLTGEVIGLETSNVLHCQEDILRAWLPGNFRFNIWMSGAGRGRVLFKGVLGAEHFPSLLQFLKSSAIHGLLIRIIWIERLRLWMFWFQWVFSYDTQRRLHLRTFQTIRIFFVFFCQSVIRLV